MLGLTPGGAVPGWMSRSRPSCSATLCFHVLVLLVASVSFFITVCDTTQGQTAGEGNRRRLVERLSLPCAGIQRRRVAGRGTTTSSVPLRTGTLTCSDTPSFLPVGLYVGSHDSRCMADLVLL